MPPESDSAPHSKRHNTFLGCIGNIQFACDGTLTHNNDPVAHRQEFLHFGRNHNNGFPLGNQFIDQVVNLTFCANINVKSWKGRSHLTAMLSEDDGETWPYTLLLDERNEVSYPDAKEADNGYIYVTYDWERVTQREILMARFTEDDILRGKILSPEGKLRVLVNKALGQPDIH